MTREKVLVVFILAILSLVKAGYSVNPVVIEFLYYKPCSVCPSQEVYYQAYLHNKHVVTNILWDYGNKVLVEWIPFFSTEGLEKVEQYNLTFTDWNSIVVNYEVVLKGGEQFINETRLRELVDFYLGESPPIHDVAIISLLPASSSVLRGEVLDINVTAKNEGNQVESFNITVCCNSTLIETVFVDSLGSNTERVLVFRWNTTEVAEGNYTLSAQAYGVQNETDTNDNLFCYEVVEVRAPSTLPTIKHDVAVISVIPSQTVMYVGEKVNFTVAVKNVGTETESFNVNTYCNESLIGTQTITGLAPNETRLVFFIWDTTNKTPGDYPVRVTAESVPNEINLLDNERADSKIRVKASPLSLMAMLVLALSVGFFETFSPCLIVMLSFILSYAMGHTSRYGASFLQVMVFGAGFVSASAVLGLAFGLVFLSMPTLRISLTWAVCIFAVLFGLNLLGLLKMPFETKPLIKKLTRKYVATYIGIFALGFVFYFLDPCIAPIFVSMVPLMFSGALPLILFVFCLGAIVPFVGIGLFTGSVSKLARSTYRHRSAIRSISGLILIGYALYLIVFDLIL